MNVIIDPNLKKTSERIDVEGNKIDPRTKKIIEPHDKGSYVPTSEELAAMHGKPTEPAPVAPAVTPKIEHSEAVYDALADNANPKDIQAEIDKIDAEYLVLDNRRTLLVAHKTKRIAEIKAELDALE